MTAAAPVRPGPAARAGPRLPGGPGGGVKDAIRVLLVDGHALFRAGLRMLLNAQPGVVVLGEAAETDEGVRKALQLRPDVVLMDLSTAGGTGLDAVRQVVASGVASRVLVLSDHGEAKRLMPLVKAGAAGYVTRDSGERELVDAIRTVARGDVYLCPGAAACLAEALRAARGPRADPFRSLSAREREVLVLTAQGFSASEIGARLALSHKTVETYRHRLMDKLHLHHRSEVVRFALDRGMLAGA